MGRLTNDKKIKLLRIEKSRAILANELKIGLIKEEDILNLLKCDVDYGLRKKGEKLNYKQSLLKDIFNCPFLLCDQTILSLDIKKILPLFINTRYDIEKKSIEDYYKSGYINKEEYEKEIDELNFCFYNSSNDGKSILKTGCVLGVKDNITRTR